MILPKHKYIWIDKYLGKLLTGLLSVPELKSKKKLGEEGERLARRYQHRLKRSKECKVRNACQSAGLTPALSFRKLCLVTILRGTGEQPGVFLRSCQLSDKLRCVITQARPTWHGSVVRNCSPLPLEPCCSSGAEEQRGSSGAQQGQVSLWCAQAAAEPPKLPNKLFTAPLCTCVRVLVVDGPHVSTEALLSARQDSATQMGTKHLAREHWRSPCEKSAITSRVNKTSLSNLCNINPKVMNKSRSAFLALVCRGAEDWDVDRARNRNRVLCTCQGKEFTALLSDFGCGFQEFQGKMLLRT